MSVVDDFCELLSTYNGRDKVVRLACYVLKLWGSVNKNEGMLRASSKLSATRQTLRLFDDIPMLRYTYNYGLGRQEAEVTSSILGVCGNMIDHIFLPVEKICWFSDIGMLKISKENSKFFDTFNTTLWVASLYITLLKCLKQLKHITSQTQCLKLATEGEDIQRQVGIKHRLELITALKLSIDIVHAVNCLPEGWMWGGKLDNVKIGCIATASSIIGIGLHFARKKYLK